MISWQPSDNTARGNAYHPEPILFVHGINDNDASWGTVAIPALKNAFAAYDLPESATDVIGAISNLNARQEAYLHTFNYGDSVLTTSRHCRIMLAVQPNQGLNASLFTVPPAQ